MKHVKIESVDFSGIRATEDLAEPGSKQVSLWEEILCSVLVGKTLSEDRLRLLGRGQPLSAPIMATLLEDCLRQLGAGVRAPRAACSLPGSWETRPRSITSVASSGSQG